MGKCIFMGRAEVFHGIGVVSLTRPNGIHPGGLHRSVTMASILELHTT